MRPLFLLFIWYESILLEDVLMEAFEAKQSIRPEPCLDCRIKSELEPTANHQLWALGTKPAVVWHSGWRPSVSTIWFTDSFPYELIARPVQTPEANPPMMNYIVPTCFEILNLLLFCFLQGNYVFFLLVRQTASSSSSFSLRWEFIFPPVLSEGGNFLYFFYFVFIF